MQLVEDKRLLERGGASDVQELSHLVQREIGAAGYLPRETDWLYQCLVQAAARFLIGNEFAGSLAAATYLSAYPTPVARETLFQFAEALRYPEKFGGAMLSKLLVDAGQENARLVSHPDGRLKVEGSYTFRMLGEGEDGRRLQEALERVGRGETVTINASYEGSIRFTTGHAAFDRILRFDQHLSTLRLSPMPEQSRKSLLVRVRRGAEVTVDAILQVEPGRRLARLIVGDRP